MRAARYVSLLLSIPLAFFCLVLGLGAFILLGMFVDRVPSSWAFLVRCLPWVLIAILFYTLWNGQSHVALTLRLILMIAFSVIIIAALAFVSWWMTSQPALLMVISLCAMGSFNVVFYAHWVRLAALKHSLE